MTTAGGELLRLRVRVDEIGEEAEGVLSLKLVSTAGPTMPAWDPGAHIDVDLGPGIVRQYSLCGDPADLSSWRIAVLREQASRGGSEWVHARLQRGDELSILGWRNHFPLIEAESYLFIAGGIGITPLLPMIGQLADRGADWELLYGGRRRDSMAFVGELAVHGERVQVWPEDERGLLDLPGRLGAPRSDTAIYCCGPEPLIEAVEAAAAHWPVDSLHVERFRPRPGALEGENRAFEVVLGDSGMTVQVSADETIIEALEAAGVDVPTSCREGICGTCETQVIEGEVDHRDSFLTEEEHEMGTMMICCSRARSERLVLDI
jgi:ferredoxin-NADP reductase